MLDFLLVIYKNCGFFFFSSLKKENKKNKKLFFYIYNYLYINHFLLFVNIFLLIEGCGEFACATMKNVLRTEFLYILCFYIVCQKTGDFRLMALSGVLMS